MKAIDTHVHTWNFERAEYAWLRGNTSLLGRTYLVEELEPQLQEAGVSEGVLVQAANTEEETSYLLEVAASHSWLKGVVGWMPLEDPKRVSVLLQQGYGTHRLFRGVRHLIHDEPDERWLLQPSVLDCLQLLAAAGVPYDVVGIREAHLETVLEVLGKVPGLRIVLDHLNQPPITKGSRYGRWGDLVQEVSSHPEAYAKISGLGTTASKGENWSKDDVTPYIEFAIRHFGAGRCVCGGDWPVSLLAGSYVQAWKTYRETLLSLLPEDEAAKVLYDNAVSFYRL